MDYITDLMDIILSELQELVMAREAPNKKLENIKYTHIQQNRTHIQHDSKEIKPVNPKGNQP